MRYLFILLLLSGCASYQAKFNADLETVQGVKQTELVETWGDPFVAGTLEGGMDYARVVFDNAANQRFKCHVDVLIEDNAAVHSRWGGYWAWAGSEERAAARTRVCGGGAPVGTQPHPPRG